MKLINSKIRRPVIIGVAALMCIVALFGFCGVESSSNYMKKVESIESDFTVEKIIQEVKFSVRYYSPTYLAIKQLKKNNNSEKISFSELKVDFEETIDFGFRIDLPDDVGDLKKVVSSTGEYQALVDYLAFRIQKDILLIIDDQEYNCSFSHFERNYDTAPFLQLQFGFNRTSDLIQQLKDKKHVSIKFNADHFNLGPIYFQFNKNTILDNPTIIL